jgi:L-ascorbate metabolism protein UlaG (beta-lactamase superfamily)
MSENRSCPLSDHFNGTRFHNPVRRTHGFLDLVRWMATRKQGRWPEATSNTYAPAPPKQVDDLRVTFIGHTTLLLQMNGLNILTDPIWSMRASPVSWVGPRRRAMPGIRFGDLPPIHAVVISHDHYDHFDAPTLTRLAQEHDPVFIAGLGNDHRLKELGIKRSVALDWWKAHQLRPNFRVTAVPARHFSGRNPFDRDSTLWCGFVLQGPAGCAYFAGDTGFGDHFSKIGTKFSPMRIALLPIGAFRPEWFMGEVHCTPEEAVEAHRILAPRISVATHFGTFPLADDGQIEPIERLREALKEDLPDGGVFWVLGFGEGRDVPPL